jgi:hypothetical protein
MFSLRNAEKTIQKGKQIGNSKEKCMSNSEYFPCGENAVGIASDFAITTHKQK